jgi:hypothetical protein
MLFIIWRVGIFTPLEQWKYVNNISKMIRLGKTDYGIQPFPWNTAVNSNILIPGIIDKVIPV